MLTGFQISVHNLRLYVVGTLLDEMVLLSTHNACLNYNFMLIRLCRWYGLADMRFSGLHMIQTGVS